MLIVIVDLSVVTIFPNASSMLAAIEERTVFIFPDTGGFVKTNFAAAAGVTVKLPLVAVVNDPSAALSVKLPALVSTRLENVATPALAAAVSVPVSVPSPETTEIVTSDAVVVTRFPYASSTCTTVGLIAFPATVVVGPVAKTNFAAAAGVIVKLPLVAEVNDPSAALSV
jgi:hypothetical protein